jgi:hypothetical protein
MSIDTTVNAREYFKQITHWLIGMKLVPEYVAREWNRELANCVLRAIKNSKTVGSAIEVWYNNSRLANRPDAFSALPMVAQRIILEWPHESTKEPDKLAYTRDSDKGARDIQTVTSPGKYLAGLCPWLKGHEVEMFTTKPKAIIRELKGEDIIKAMWTCKASSCMTRGNDSRWSKESHPYRVYSEDLGWSLMCEYASDAPDAPAISRALVNNKKYVRIFAAGRGEDDIIPDSASLRGWFMENGYQKIGDWTGFSMKKIDHPVHSGYVIMPYLDNGGYGRCVKFVDGAYLIGDEGMEALSQLGLIVDRTGKVQLSDGNWVEESKAIRAGGCFYLAEQCVELYSGGYWPKDSAYKLTTGKYRNKWAKYDECSKLTNGKRCLTSESVVALGEFKLKSECVHKDGFGWVPKGFTGELRELASATIAIGGRVKLNAVGMERFGHQSEGGMGILKADLGDFRSFPLVVQWANGYKDTYPRNLVVAVELVGTGA